MLLYSRRFTVWLVSFLAVMVIYFIYNRLSRTPLIVESGSRQIVEPAADVCDSNSKVGMVGEVGVGVVRNARYITLNAQKQVEREFGFKELLHQDGNEWEIEEPYMTIYRRDFKCELRGKRARVVVETAAGQVTPKEGLLTGDVTIRIWPRSKGGFGEGVLYLDDVAFVGEKSMFSTAGLVEYVSNDVRLAGTGMELVYNGDAERLELLKITKLQSLRVRRWSRGTVLGSTSLTTGGSGSPRQGTSGVEEGQEGNKASKPGQSYRCVLDKNVVIETVRERLLAEVVLINDIFVRGGEAGEAGIKAPPGEQGEVGATSAIGGQRDANWAAVETAGDVAISCDGGVVITPMDSAGGQMTQSYAGQAPSTSSPDKDFRGRAGQEAEALRCDSGQATRGGKAMFCGWRFDFSVATGEAVAPGASQITFDVNDKSQGAGGRPFDGSTSLTAGPAQGRPATVKITSQRQARFEPASNKVFFEGDCRCTVTQEQGDAVQQYLILADSLEVDLAQKDGNKPGTTLDVERLVATGGEVHLASTKKTVRPGSPQVGERLLGGVELKGAGMDYNVASRDFFLSGPGLLKVDNSQTDEPQKGLGRFSLRRKCYAVVRNFNFLKFDGGSNHLVADSNGGSVLLDYFPLTEEGGEDKVAVTASHVEADVLETTQKRTEMTRLVAQGAVTYEDKDIDAAGSEFVYDANSAVINISGDRSMPCRFNGAIVDMVQYDVKTGKWRTKIKGPGAIK